MVVDSFIHSFKKEKQKPSPSRLLDSFPPFYLCTSFTYDDDDFPSKPPNNKSSFSKHQSSSFLGNKSIEEEEEEEGPKYVPNNNSSSSSTNQPTKNCRNREQKPLCFLLLCCCCNKAKMTEMDGSNTKPPPPPPQIYETFHKFALAFKTKTIEFFAEEEEEDEALATDESDPLLLLDSAEEVITGQRVVVIKPDSSSSSLNKPKPIPKNLQQTLISSLFATISSFEASYLQFQTAHTPFHVDNVKAADQAAVSQLQKLSEIKKYYSEIRKNPNPNPNSNNLLPFRSQFEAQVEENQSLLRTLEMLFNRLQLEIDDKDVEVLMMKQKLDKIDKSNLKLSKRLSSLVTKSEVLLSIGVFDSVLHDACRSSHRFSKILIDLMEEVGWDLDLAANSVHPDVVEYAKIGHNRYAFLSYVCLGMFRGFDLEGFGYSAIREDDEFICNGIDSIAHKKKKKNTLRQFVEHSSSDAMEVLSKNPKGCFARFCEHKYQELIHPTMESSLFKNLDQNELILNSWRSTAAFYESFVEMASSIWMLHKLAFSFEPTVEIFQVERGVDFSMVYMENVTRRNVSPPSKTRPKVEFTVIPGFKIGSTVIQCQVYVTGSKK